MDAIRRDQPLAVFLQPFGGRLLIAGLDEVLAIVGGDGHVTCQHQQRRARAMRHGDIHDHVGEAGAFGARTRGHFAGAARKSVRGRGHRAFRTPAKRGNARRRDRVDDLVIARAAEQRREIFVLARFRENLGARHSALGVERPKPGRLGEAVGNILGDANRGNRSRRWRRKSCPDSRSPPQPRPLQRRRTGPGGMDAIRVRRATVLASRVS